MGWIEALIWACAKALSHAKYRKNTKIFYNVTVFAFTDGAD